MNKNRCLAGVLCGVLLVSPMTVSADTKAVETTMIVTADMLGGLEVLVPDSLILEQDSETKDFIKEANIIAKGYLEANNTLVISTEPKITYKNEFNIEVEGAVDFESSDTSDVSLSSDMLAVKDTDGNLVGTAIPFTVTVPLEDITAIGTYKSTVNFGIEVVDNDIFWQDYYGYLMDIEGSVHLLGFSNDLVDIPTDLYIPAKYYNQGVLQGEISIISNGAFQNQSSIESVKLPDSITTIEENAFNGCSALKEVIYKGVSYTDMSTIANDLTNAGIEVQAGAFD